MNKKEIFLYSPSPKKTDAVKVWFGFPATYHIGMSALGYLSLFKLLDTHENAHPERIFSDTTTTSHKKNEVELFGFSFSFEFDFLSIFKTLENYGIPLFAKDRTEEHPIIFAGGPVISVNPEPFADFFDFLMIGDGENITNIIDSIYQNRTLSKSEKLIELSKIEGIYVPSLYKIEYNEDFSIKNIYPEIKVKKSTKKQLKCMYSAIITEDTMFKNNCLIEIARGCPNRCAFCIASYANLPFRFPPYNEIIDAIEQGIEKVGKIGLLGALVTAHPEFDKITDYLLSKLDEKEFEVSISSLRADKIERKTIQMLKKAGQKSATIAVEAGSQRLRNFINKNLTTEQIFETVKTISEEGLSAIKIYSMIGLPSETMDDIKELAELMIELNKKNRSLSLTLSSSSFVPKAQTPFQRYGREDAKVLKEKNDYLKKILHINGIKYRPTSVKWDNIQGLLSRGDRRLAPILVEFYKYSASLGSINRAYKECQEKIPNLPPFEWYSQRIIEKDEILPWNMLEFSHSKDYLEKELLRLKNLETK